jgi:hypothetical protein
LGGGWRCRAGGSCGRRRKLRELEEGRREERRKGRRKARWRGGEEREDKAGGREQQQQQEAGESERARARRSELWALGSRKKELAKPLHGRGTGRRPDGWDGRQLRRPTPLPLDTAPLCSLGSPKRTQAAPSPADSIHGKLFFILACLASLCRCTGIRPGCWESNLN